MTSQKAMGEFRDRVRAERAKALTKYGEDALLPAGRPDLDILDYAINEAVGFVRYGQMLQARHRLMAQLLESARQRALSRQTITLARELEAVGARLAMDLIDVRQQLKALGLHLGLTEGARGS